ncbi:MAG: putative aminohydrolase SsnA [Lachnospiraceae bacterium]|nr:putative aminohydrolase SsnA [Lachnospiraceae bacterium]
MLLIGNGRLVTRDDKNSFWSDGAVVIEGKRIKKVGNTQEMRQEFPDAEYIDAKGGLIMPGFINMHHHIYSAFARGLSLSHYSPSNFVDILEGMWWRIDRKLNLDDCYQSAMTTYMDCVKSGVTTIFDHHASYGAIGDSLFKISEVADRFGVRSCLCYEVSDRDGTEKMRAAVKENADFIKACQGRSDDMQYGMMGMHAAFTLSDASLELCKAHTPEGVGFHIHTAEAISDVQDSLKKYGKPVVNRLFDLGILGEKTITPHCVHVGPAEMALLRDTNTMVVSNPESNMGNAVGCPPVIRMMNEFDIAMGMGTDGYTSDMTESYKVGNIIHKHHLADPTVAWGEMPTMLFDNNPKLANRYFDTKLGVLEADAAADVIVVDYLGPTPLDGDNVNGHILFGVNGAMVRDTVIDGVVKMRNREVLGMDEQKIAADVQKQAADFWKRVN